MSIRAFFVLGFALLIIGCTQKEPIVSLDSVTLPDQIIVNKKDVHLIKIDQDILMESYFPFMDTLVLAFDSLLNYPITEHLIVRSNPWIIDTLQHTDYYHMKLRDSFVYDQKKMIILPKGSEIKIPDSIEVIQLLEKFEATNIDVNIPEFKLRIFEGDQKLFEFPIRVGKNKRTYLEMSGKEEDLRTKTGSGKIIGYNKNPRYVNPVNNHEYFVTKRDDEMVTGLPKIPFIEAEINGLRHGQLIHPTTNPETLGKASSNGCMGTKEADAWVIYYYAPIGTKIKIRYDLKIINETGQELLLPDIYNLKKDAKKAS